MPTLAQGWIDMNERIRQLAEQAGMIVGDAGEFDMAKFMPKEVKFAELIIRECSNVAWQHTPETEELEYSHLIKDKILKHFRVEE